MYHPHLFARRAELLALRDLSEHLQMSESISPILEGAKADPRDLVKCLEVLGNAGVTATVILNPVVGDFKNHLLLEPWRQALAERFSKYPKLLPGYVCRPSSTMAQVGAFLNAYHDRATALLYWSPKLPDGDVKELAALESVRFHINLHDQMSNAQRALLPTNKAVDVKDHFAKCARNADYGGPEFFSDDHLNYSENSVGFGDFSIVGSQFIAGGGQAHAVAIHGIYKTDEDSIWVEHFISNDVELEVGTVEGKYLQAAGKLVDAIFVRPNEFGDDLALEGFAGDVENGTFPGLAVSKRRQIYHHLALVNSLL